MWHLCVTSITNIIFSRGGPFRTTARTNRTSAAAIWRVRVRTWPTAAAATVARTWRAAATFAPATAATSPRRRTPRSARTSTSVPPCSTTARRSASTPKVRNPFLCSCVYKQSHHFSTPRIPLSSIICSSLRGKQHSTIFSKIILRTRTCLS